MALALAIGPPWMCKGSLEALMVFPWWFSLESEEKGDSFENSLEDSWSEEVSSDSDEWEQAWVEYWCKGVLSFGLGSRVDFDENCGYGIVGGFW